MTDASKYRFTVRSGTNEMPTIALDPSEERPVVPGALGFRLKDGITLAQAEDLRQSLSEKVSGVYCKYTNNTSQVDAAWIIGLYLVLHTLLLVGLSLLVWLASDWKQFFDLAGISHLSSKLAFTTDKFSLFQRLALSACAAGLGGSVFMIREFYIKFCYGRSNEFLKRREIPRFVLLPFSSIVLGPISLALAKTGAITFGALSTSTNVPLLTVVGVSFVLGFAYHDTLKWLAKLSERILTSRKDGAAKSPNASKAQHGASANAEERRG